MTLTRTIIVSLRQQIPSVETVRFLPRLASGDEEVILNKYYDLQTDLNGFGSIDLPVKQTGTIKYEVIFPARDSLDNHATFNLAAGSDVRLEDLLIAGTPASDSVLDFIEREFQKHLDENDPHSQYLNNSRGDARYAALNHNHNSSDIPDFAATVRSTVLTALNAGTNEPITAADSVISAFAKLQNQISNFSAVSGTEHAIPFFAADGSLTENEALFRFENIADNERLYACGRKPDGAFRFEFDGWTGSAYTTGFYLKSKSMSGYAPTHIIMENAAYLSFGSIAVTDHQVLFSHGSLGDGNLRFMFYGGYGNIFPFVINAGWAGTLWATPRIKTTSYGIAEVIQEFRGYAGQTGNIWEYRKSDNTLLTALTASGAITIISLDDEADAPNSTIFWDSLNERVRYKKPDGFVINIG